MKENVSETERLLSVIGGTALAFVGARKRGAAGAALALAGGFLVKRGVTGHCEVYEALGVGTRSGHPDWLEQQHGPAAVVDARKAERVVEAVTVNRPADELYAMWKGKLPLSGEGPTTMVNDVPNRLYAWKTAGDTQQAFAASVHFTPAPGDRGTEVRAVLEYEGQAPPVARTLREELRAFKRLAETGEPRIEAGIR